MVIISFYVEMEWDGGSSTSCGFVTKDEYDDIDDYIDKSEELSEAAGLSDVDISIDCGSNYLLISLLLLFLLFL